MIEDYKNSEDDNRSYEKLHRDVFLNNFDSDYYLNSLTSSYEKNSIPAGNIWNKIELLLNNEIDFGRDYEKMLNRFGADKWRKLFILMKKNNETDYRELLSRFDKWNMQMGGLYQMDKTIIENEILMVLGEEIGIDCKKNDKVTMELLIAESVGGENESDVRNVKMALDKYPDLLKQDGDYFDENILHCVYPRGRYCLEIVKEILSRVENKERYLNQKSSEGKLDSPLLGLFSRGLSDPIENKQWVKEVLKLYLENGADPGLADVAGNTCLHYLCGCSNNFVGLRQIFATKGEKKKLHRKIKRVLSEEEYQISKKNNLDMIDLVLRYKGDLGQKNNDGKSPWDIFIEGDQIFDRFSEKYQADYIEIKNELLKELKQ